MTLGLLKIGTGNVRVKEDNEVLHFFYSKMTNIPFQSVGSLLALSLSG